ncbi:MAG: AbrB/MazE/SpoVT family DNA-binding domain-containing protein [Candidatus Omnitrophota bacterium]
MLLRQPNTQGQLTIPKEFLKQIGFDPRHDYFDIELKEDTIVLKPVTVEPKFSDEELRKMERLFDDPANKGKVYSSAAQGMAALRRMIKKK